MKKILTVLLCLGLLLSVAGCGEKTEPVETPEISASPEPTEPAPEGFDPTPLLQAAWEKYPQDTVVLTAGGQDVTWGEYYYWIANQLSSFCTYLGAMPVWEDFIASGETYDDYFKSYAVDALQYFQTLRAKAAELDTGLSEELQAEIDATWVSTVEGLGSEEAALDYLAGIYLTKDIYDSFNEAAYLYYGIFEELYGPKGEKLSEEEVAEAAEDQGFMHVKHILYKTTNDANEPLPEEEAAAVLLAAENALQSLQAVPAEELEAAFDALMVLESDDGGLTLYPDGYTFLPGTMVVEFEDASRLLEAGEISGLVESMHGYHIILRLPLDPEGVTEYDSNTYEPIPLRYYIASSVYETELAKWQEATELEYAAEFKDFTVSSLFE